MIHTLMNTDCCDYYNHSSVTHGDERQEWLVSRAMAILDSATPETERLQPDPHFTEIKTRRRFYSQTDYDRETYNDRCDHQALGRACFWERPY